MFDTHVHLDFPPFMRRIDAVAGAALRSGVTGAVNPAVDLESSSRALLIAGRHPWVLPAVGIHPLYVGRYEKFPGEEMEKLLAGGGFKAVGEIGLDYWKGRDDRDKQREFFLSQTRLAEKYRLPVLIHSRKSFYEVMTLLKREKYSGVAVMHAFSGSYEMAVKALDMGFFISVAANVTRPAKETLRETLKRLPMDRLLVETDAPDMPYYGRRGRLHFPWDLPVTVGALAGVLGTRFEETARVTAENALRIFGREGAAGK